jgi:hypothetical protein
MNTIYIWRICISSWWSGWSSKFFGLLIHQRRGDRAVGSGGFCLSPVIIACLTYIHIHSFLYCGVVDDDAVYTCRCLPIFRKDLKSLQSPFSFKRSRNQLAVF